MASSSVDPSEGAMERSKRSNRDSLPASFVKEAQVSGIVDRKVVTDKKKTKTQFSFVLFLVWSDGVTTTVWRSYQQFFEFQVQLLMAFPDEAGETGSKPRIIPYLPGKKMFTRSDAKLAAQREPQINEYIQKLVALPFKVSRCELVLNFFTAREGDPSYTEGIAGVSYSKVDDGATVEFNKGFKGTAENDTDEDDDTREDVQVKMKKCNSSEALLTDRERTVSQTVVEIHTVPIVLKNDDETEKEEAAAGGEDEAPEKTRSSSGAGKAEQEESKVEETTGATGNTKTDEEEPAEAV